MQPAPSHHPSALPHRIELNLRDVNQLFNTMDPSPFHEKDLDHDAEEFIESWAREFPADEPIVLVVHLAQRSGEAEARETIRRAVHHFFAYRARLNQLEFRRLMTDGRRSLLVGLGFLCACLFASSLLGRHDSGTITEILRESLTIGGWVAMWRPMEIYLYGWWPVRRHGKVLRKLSRMPVEVREAATVKN